MHPTLCFYAILFFVLQVEEEAVWAQRELAAAVKEAEEESGRVASKQVGALKLLVYAALSY
jgi:hypothetical protein